MSEIEAELNRAAAAYWMSVAAKGGPGKSAALTEAGNLLRDGRAESRIPDSSRQPTLNDLEAPPMDVLRTPRMRR
jgi:hypothetical protein